MWNKRRKKNSDAIISRIEIDFTSHSMNKPYELTAEGSFVTETGRHYFECFIYVSRMSVANYVTAFIDMNLIRTADADGKEFTYDFSLPDNLRDLPHAVTYGIMNYGRLDEEATIEVDTSLLDVFWEVVVDQDA